MPVGFAVCVECEAINERDAVRCHRCGNALTTPLQTTSAVAGVTADASTAGWDGRIIVGPRENEAPVPAPESADAADARDARRRRGRVVRTALLVVLAGGAYLAYEHRGLLSESIGSISSLLRGSAQAPQVPSMRPETTRAPPPSPRPAEKSDAPVSAMP